MDQMTLLYVMTAFVIIAAIALCIQAGMLAAMYKTTKSLQAEIRPLLPKVESLVDTTKITVEQSRKQIVEITALLTLVNLDRFNAAFGIGSAGFSAGRVCVLPDRVGSAAG